MMSDPYKGSKRMDKSSAGKHGSAVPGFGMSAPSPTYDGITYVIETERLTKTPDNGTPERGAA